MATAANTIKLALRKLRVIGQGESPDSAAQTDALTELNNMIWGLLNFGGSLQWRDVYADSSIDVTDYATYFAQRILVRHSGAVTVTLPEGTADYPVPDGFRLEIVDASNNAATYNITVARNGWLIAGAASNATISTNNARKTYMFRADLGDWKLAADLGASDSLPFPAEFDGGVALMLAHRLSGEYGKSLSPQDELLRIDAENQLYNRYCTPPKLFPDGAVQRLGGATAWSARTGQDMSTV